MLCRYFVGLVVDSLDESTQSDDDNSLDKQRITPITSGGGVDLTIDDPNTSDSISSAKRYVIV